MHSRDLRLEGQPCLVALRVELHKQRLSNLGDPYAKNVRAFRKRFRILPIMAYDDDMSGLQASLLLLTVFYGRYEVRTCPSTRVAAHFAKISMTSSLPPVV